MKSVFTSRHVVIVNIRKNIVRGGGGLAATAKMISRSKKKNTKKYILYIRY